MILKIKSVKKRVPGGADAGFGRGVEVSMAEISLKEQRILRFDGWSSSAAFKSSSLRKVTSSPSESL
jgi:hypothetical protein